MAKATKRLPNTTRLNFFIRVVRHAGARSDRVVESLSPLSAGSRMTRFLLDYPFELLNHRNLLCFQAIPFASMIRCPVRQNERGKHFFNPALPLKHQNFYWQIAIPIKFSRDVHPFLYLGMVIVVLEKNKMKLF